MTDSPDSSGSSNSSTESDPATSTTFTATLALSITAIFVVIILIALLLGALRSQTTFIIAIVETGASFFAAIGKSIVTQAQAVVSANAGAITQSGSACFNAITTSVATVVNALLAVGGSVLQTILDGFTFYAEALADFASQVITIFFTFLAPAFALVNQGLVEVSALLDVIGYAFKSVQKPVQQFFTDFMNYVNTPSSACSGGFSLPP